MCWRSRELAAKFKRPSQQLSPLKKEKQRTMIGSLEKSWFVNRWGKIGQWIVSDLYLEQQNYWIKVFQFDLYLKGKELTLSYSVFS